MGCLYVPVKTRFLLFCKLTDQNILDDLQLIEEY